MPLQHVHVLKFQAEGEYGGVELAFGAQHMRCRLRIIKSDDVHRHIPLCAEKTVLLIGSAHRPLFRASLFYNEDAFKGLCPLQHIPASKEQAAQVKHG